MVFWNLGTPTTPVIPSPSDFPCIAMRRYFASPWVEAETVVRNIWFQDLVFYLAPGCLVDSAKALFEYCLTYSVSFKCSFTHVLLPLTFQVWSCSRFFTARSFTESFGMGSAASIAKVSKDAAAATHARSPMSPCLSCRTSGVELESHPNDGHSSPNRSWALRSQTPWVYSRVRAYTAEEWQVRFGNMDHFQDFHVFADVATTATVSWQIAYFWSVSGHLQHHQLGGVKVKLEDQRIECDPTVHQIWITIRFRIARYFCKVIHHPPGYPAGMAKGVSLLTVETFGWSLARDDGEKGVGFTNPRSLHSETGSLRSLR